MNENVFGNKNYLCHYTSFANLCSILSTMTLRICSFAKSNDIGELESNISCILNSKHVYKIEQYIENHCGYISFSTNKKFSTKFSNPLYGYLIPSMWGIYADKSQGACLVIDEKSLIKENRQLLLCAKWYEFRNISYAKFQGHKLVLSTEDPEEITHSMCRHLLCTKHKSWNHEQERRLVGADLPRSLSLKNNVIRGIVIGKRFSQEQKNHLTSIIKDSNLACYGQINENMFVCQELLGGNVYTSDFGDI